MSISAAHASAFYREVIEHQEVWTVRDQNGFPAPEGSDGHRTMPFWSLLSRAERVITSIPAYRDFEVVSLPLERWTEDWLPGLDRDGILVGLNWSGPRATGFDVPAQVVADTLETLETLGTETN
ncbi:DUF2750 domain-containing protein [Arthrobacter sp. RCC_34]|uniref:DUF2750 domain-containing protein n=1 Tax=Arthrobacter sp. RCC_34 TaxID=3239230 RepID=UPI0035256745